MAEKQFHPDGPIPQAPASIPAAGDSATAGSANLLRSALGANDDTPTIISQGSQTPLRSEEALALVLRGKSLAHFELIEPIGIGGMAAVIRARDTQLDRTVALKILPPDLAADTEIVRRFHQEARAAAKLDHENIARVFFCGQDQGLHFIAFEFVEGENLRAHLDRCGPIAVPDAISYMLQIATGLAHAASRGVVHRDIKPSNIIVSPNGRAKLVDMGLARSLEPHSDGELTQSGVTLGTFDYISPEQALEPRDADVRSDIYSLGCTFYHVLTGQAPVPEGTAARKLHHHQHIAPADPRQLNQGIPDDVAAVLGRMMAKEPKDRYQRPEHLVQHLIVLAQKLGAVSDAPEGVLFVDAPLPSPAQTRPLLIGAAAVLAVIGLIAFMGQEPSAPSTVTIAGPTGTGVAAVGQSTSNGAGHPATEENGTSERPTGAEASLRHVGDAKELMECLDSKNPITVILDKSIRLSREQQLRFKGSQLTLQSVPAPSGMRPTLSLKYDGNPIDEPLAILKIESGVVAIKGIRFEIDASEANITVSAIHRLGGRITVEDCEFAQLNPPLQELGRASSLLLEGRPPATGEPAAIVRQCYFASGQHACTFAGGIAARVWQCAFAPHQTTLFDVRQANGVEFGADTEIDLLQCSFLLREGVVFRMPAGAPSRFLVKHCVFSRPDRLGTNSLAGSLIEQVGGGVSNCRYVGSGNYYHHLGALSVRLQAGEPREAILRLRDFQHLGLVEDSRSIESDASPWESPDPLQTLQRQPRIAFRVNVNLPALRQVDNPMHLIGVEHCAWGPVYSEDLPSLDKKSTDAVVKREDKVVDPTIVGFKENTFKNLRQAMEDAQPGDTILIKHNGVLAAEPVRLEKSGLDVTVKPYPDHHPVLTIGQTTELDPALFRVHDGQLRLERLEFHLAPSRRGFQNQTIAAIMGNGQCSFRDCVLTLEENKDVALAAVALADPSSVMRMDPGTGQQDPRVAFDGCFVRGSGNLLSVRASRPFDLRVEETLVALDGSLLVVDANPKESGPRSHASITLRQVTTYLTENLVLLRGLKDEGKVGKGLVQTQVKSAIDCLFASASANHGKSLVHLDGVDSEEPMKRYFAWTESRHNAYSNFGQYLDQEASPTSMMTPPAYGQKEWREFTTDESSRFDTIRFSDPPTGPLSRAVASSFNARMEGNGPLVGVDWTRLPRPSEEGALHGLPED